MSTAHTPGPWSVDWENADLFSQTSARAWINAEGLHHIGYVDGPNSYERAANARLIEQAPTLLDALKFAEAALADIGDADREPGDDLAWCEARAAEALPRVRAAIKAAEGAA